MHVNSLYLFNKSTFKIIFNTSIAWAREELLLDVAGDKLSIANTLTSKKVTDE